MRFDIFGRYQLEIRRVGTEWVAYRPGAGTLLALPDLVIPPELTEAQLAGYLYDLLHELSEPGRSLRRVD